MSSNPTWTQSEKSRKTKHNKLQPNQNPGLKVKKKQTQQSPIHPKPIVKSLEKPNITNFELT